MLVTSTPFETNFELRLKFTTIQVFLVAKATCPYPVDPANGNVFLILPQSSSGIYYEDARAFSRCNDGFAVSNYLSICQTDGTWSPITTCTGNNDTPFHKFKSFID